MRYLYMETQTHRETTPASHERVATDGQRVLIVEDELIVAMLVEDWVADLGYEVAGVVGRLDDALASLRTCNFDLAILDVHLNGKLVFPFADALEAKGVPFLFATAYGKAGVPDR
jgi:CheY-like chemotaxis protein